MTLTAKNPPNTWGKDIFGFYIQSNRLLPFGSPSDTLYSQSNCNSSSSADGHGCAYPYIYGFSGSVSVSIPFGTGASCSSTNPASYCTENNTQGTQFIEVSGGCTLGAYAPTDTTGTGCSNGTISGSCGDGPNSFTCLAYGYGCSLCTSGESIYVATADLSGNYTYANALTACTNLNTNGVTGWHLPTIDQVNSIFLQEGSIGGFSTNTNFNYWSSTYMSSYYNIAWAICLLDDSPVFLNPINSWKVRCVRSS